MDEKKRILIVDDEEDITWAISKNLKNSNTNLEIKCVHDGDAAYKLLNDQTFDFEKIKLSPENLNFQ